MLKDINGKKNNYKNNLRVNNYNNNGEIETQNAYIQVNLIEDIISQEKEKINKEYKNKEKEMKFKIKDLTQNLEEMKEQNNKTILELKKELNLKKEEIIKLTSQNFKMKKKLESMSEKVNDLLNKVMEKKQLNEINNNKNSNKHKIYELKLNNNEKKDNNINLNDIDKDINNNKSDDSLNDIINIKNKQIKDSLSMIEYLTKEKNKLKSELSEIRAQTNKLSNGISNNIQSKYNLKNGKVPSFNIKKNNISNKNNDNLETKDGIEKENAQENKISKDYKTPTSKNDENDEFNRRFKYSETIYKKILLKKFNNTNKRAMSTANLFDSKKQVQENVNLKLNKLFNESERKALSTLFKSNEEFECFNQKITVLQNHNSSIEKKLLTKIRILSHDNDDKGEQIEYLQGKLRECESKLKILEHKLNCEKFLLKQAKKSNKNHMSFENSPEKTFNNISNSDNKDNKESSLVINNYMD